MCGMEEDIEHVIFKCRWTNAVWLDSLELTNGHQNRDTIAKWIHDRGAEQMPNKERREER